jgi:hypothetical protein
LILTLGCSAALRACWRSAALAAFASESAINAEPNAVKVILRMMF